MNNLTPLYSSVCAGSPSPIDDGQEFNLAEYLRWHSQNTLYVRVSGDSMNGAGISSGDLLIVDTSLEPNTSDIVIAQTDDGFTVKRYIRKNGRLSLVPANPNYKAISTNEDARICGVATFVIH